MIRIGICDDDLSVLGQIQRMMDHYRVSRNEEMVTLTFQSPLELIHEIERGCRFDILLMDVLMPGENGMEAAERRLRRYDTAVRIIFLTSSQEFAVDSYKVGAFLYQLKPILEESLFSPGSDSAIAECARQQRCRIDRSMQKRRDPCRSGSVGILRSNRAGTDAAPFRRKRAGSLRQHG